MRSHAFVAYDDTVAVYENSKLRLALGWDGLRWALTANYVGNWIPLTCPFLPLRPVATAPPSRWLRSPCVGPARSVGWPARRAEPGLGSSIDLHPEAVQTPGRAKG